MSQLVVLVVDDDDLTRKLASERLERKGFLVLRASSGEEALLMARGHVPHLVLLDIQMPGLSGFDVLRAIRSDPLLASTRVIAMTASIMPENRGRIDQEDFDAVLAKPFRINELLRVVGAQLGHEQGE
jgi:CheY-like chemotaxis protein